MFYSILCENVLLGTWRSVYSNRFLLGLDSPTEKYSVICGRNLRDTLTSYFTFLVTWLLGFRMQFSHIQWG